MIFAQRKRRRDCVFAFQGRWIVVPCDEEGNIRSGIKIPGKNEIYAQIAFQEQFYSGVLVGL